MAVMLCIAGNNLLSVEYTRETTYQQCCSHWGICRVVRFETARATQKTTGAPPHIMFTTMKMTNLTCNVP